jgi:hypothetical protein
MGRHTLIWPTKGNQLRGPRMPPPRALAAADRDPLVSLPPRVPWRGADTAGPHVCWSSSRTCLLDFASLACGPPLPVSPSTDFTAHGGRTETAREKTSPADSESADAHLHALRPRPPPVTSINHRVEARIHHGRLAGLRMAEREREIAAAAVDGVPHLGRRG